MMFYLFLLLLDVTCEKLVDNKFSQQNFLYDN